MVKESERINLMGKRFALLVTALLVCAGFFTALAVQPTSAQSAVSITINNYAFTPNKITVVIGVNNTVTWTMEQSGVPYHTVTPNPGDPDESWGSGQLTTGMSYSFTFTVAGTYGYHCSLHTYMTGTVVVEAASGTSSVSTTQSSASSQSPAGSVPEFPLVTVGVFAFIAVLLVSYVLVRRGKTL